MSMARDASFRPERSGEAYSRDPAPAGPRSNDPLAELARLIGQDDPFAAVAKEHERGASRPAAEPRSGQTTPEWLARPHPEGPESPHDDAAGYHDAGYEEAHYYEAQQPGYEAGEHQEGYPADGYYDGQEGYQEGYGEEGYEEPRRRRGGVVTIAAVVGLALVGTVGVFTYRAWTGPSTPGGEPPVIKAEQTPTKVPAAPAADPTGKQINDRVADRGAEQVVPREEQPVDPKTAVRPAAPAATMGGMATGSIGSVFPPAAAPQTATPTGTEPKKVKTETIRPNQAAAMPPVNQPARVANMAPAVAAPPAAAPATRPATSPTQPTQPAQQAQPPARTATLEGGYVVQVASQRSEADAQSSFKALQQKYPTVLGGYQVIVRRADLGDKGIYYRAQVGPFATAEQANEMCTSLKNAGGQCLVQSVR